MIFQMNDISSGYICTIRSQTVFESQPFYLVSRCSLLIVVVSQPVHLVSLCPLRSLSTFMSQPICHESVSPPEIPERAKQTSNILQRSSVLSQLLTQRAPKVKYPQSKAKSSARVLTSSENLMLLEEKERKKEEAEEKQRRRKESESDWHWRKQSTRD